MYRDEHIHFTFHGDRSIGRLILGLIIEMGIILFRDTLEAYYFGLFI